MSDEKIDFLGCLLTLNFRYHGLGLTPKDYQTAG